MNRRSFLYKSLAGGGIAALGVANVAVFRGARTKRNQPAFPKNEDVCTIAFSLHGNRLAVASANDRLSIWDPVTGQRVSFGPASHGGKVASMSFYKDDSWLASLSQGRFLKITKPVDEKAASFVEFESDPTTVAFSPSYDKGITPSPCVAAVGLADHSIRIARYDERERISLRMAFPSQKEREDPRIVKILAPFREKKALKGHADRITGLAFSVDGSLLASASADKTVRIWSTNSWGANVLTGSNSPINCVSFSQDGRRLAGGCADGSIVVWDLVKGTRLGIVRGHSDSVLSAVFLRDTNWLATTSADRATIIWSVQDNLREGLRLPENPGKYPSIDISADGQYLASSWGKEVRFWKTSDLESDARRNLGDA